MKTTFLAILLSVSLSIPTVKAAGTFQLLSFETVNASISRIHRDTADGLIVLETSAGTFFTRPSSSVPLSAGGGRVLLQDEQSFEAFLLAHVNMSAQLILCREVNGLVVGATFDNGESQSISASIQQD